MSTDIPTGEFLLPLFPLPNLVFFPHTRLPLHVFEPRYRQLVNDAIGSEQRFGIVLLQPGWENDYYGTPPIHDFGTLGIIEQSMQLSDGRYNLLLNGIVRFRINEIVTLTPYRVARVVAEPELPGALMDAWAQREWLADLSKRYLEYLPGDAEVPEIASATLDSLTNALIMSLSFDVEEKQSLLETSDLIQRATDVGELLEKKIAQLQMLAPFRRATDPSNN
jgi:uncharacterized protein